MIENGAVLLLFWQDKIIPFFSSASWAGVAAIASVAVAIIALWKENFKVKPDLILEKLNFEGKRADIFFSDRTIKPGCFYHLTVKNLRPRAMARGVSVFVNAVCSLRENNEWREVKLYPPRELAWTPMERGEVSPHVSIKKHLDLAHIVGRELKLGLMMPPSSNEHIVGWGVDANVELELIADNSNKNRIYNVKFTWLCKDTNTFQSCLKNKGLAPEDPCGWLKIELSEITNSK